MSPSQGRSLRFPLEAEECHVFTARLHVYHRLANGQTFVDYDLHCCLPGQFTMEEHSIAQHRRRRVRRRSHHGPYEATGRRSPIVNVGNLTFLNTPPGRAFCKPDNSTLSVLVSGLSSGSRKSFKRVNPPRSPDSTQFGDSIHLGSELESK